MTGRSRLARLAILSVLAAALVACGGAEDRKARHQERGDALFAEGNYDKARIEYKNVLQIDPKDVKARVGLAQTLEKLEQWREAVGHYRAAVEADPQNLQARVQLGRLFLLGNALDEADKLAGEALALSAGSADALALRGGVKMRRGDVDGAIADGDAALKSDPANTHALSLLASAYANKGDAGKATELLERAVASSPKNANLRMALAGVYIQKKEPDRAVKLFQDLVDQDPESLTHRIRLAALYTGLKRLDEGEKVLRDAIARKPSDVQARLALAEFLASQRGRDVAEAELKAQIEKDPAAYALRFALAKLHESAGQLEEAKKVYEELIVRARLEPQGLEGRTKLARVLARQNDLDGAARRLEEVLKQNPKDEDALVLRGSLAMVRNEPTKAIADYRAALKGQPSSANILTLLARAHLANNELQLAEENLRRAVDVDPANIASRLTLVRFLVQTNKADTAMEQVEAALKASPGNASVLEMKARIQLARRDWDGAVATAKAVAQAAPKHPLGQYLEGLAQQGKGDHAAAVALFEQAMERAPKAVEPLTALVQTLLIAKKPDQALARLDKVIAAQPESALAWNLKGEVLLSQKKSAEAEAALKKAVELAPKSAVAYRNLAIADLLSGDAEGAVQAFREGVDATGGQAALRFQLASLYEQLGRYDEAIGEHEAMLKASPDSLAVANNLAMLLVSYRTDAASLNRARELAAKLEGSDNAAFLDTLGWVQYRKGELDPALANLKKALEKEPGSAIMHYHLGMAYHAKGDAARAKEHLQKAVAGDSRFVGVEEAKATLAKLK